MSLSSKLFVVAASALLPVAPVASALPAAAAPSRPGGVSASAATTVAAGARQGVSCPKSFRQRYGGRLLVTGAFCGHRLSDREIAQTLRRAGFPRWMLADAVATVLAESAGYDRTVRFNRNRVGVVTSIDYDLWQINSRWHPQVNRLRRGDSFASSRLAWQIVRRSGLKTWHGYAKRGAYMARARAAAAAVR